jgi:pimeloyl-ACP methyl ester carboxylesterase
VAPPRLHVDAEGAGPAIALLHGFGGSARNFGPQARALRARWRVLRWDARGHARSEAPADPAAYAPEAFVEDVGRVLDGDGVPEAVVGGLSMGAGVALRFALAHPERTRGLVLAAFPPGADQPGTFAGVARQFADALESEGVDAAGARFVWGPASGLDPNAAALVRKGFREHTARGLAGTLRGLLARQPPLGTLEPALARLGVPTLVIVGANDRLSLEPSRTVARAVPGARLVVVPDAGHVVNLEAPAPFNAALTAFLDALPRR